jgi:biopolymer transport protein ExbD
MARVARELPESEINLTSLIDVVFFLLIFFMTSSTLARVGEESAAVELPQSAVATPPQDGPRKIQVVVRGDGEFMVDGRRTEDAGLEGVLRTQARSREGPARVVIRAGKEARFEAIRQVMRAASAAGLPDVLFMTLEERS